MKLLLTSAGITNKSIAKALQDLIGKPATNTKIVFIPTAANVEEGDKGWLIDDLCNLKKQNFFSIDIVDISAIPKKIWLPRIKDADILVFGGGNTFHLTQWIEKSGLKEILPELLKDKIYVGISAGSMVASNKIFLKELKKLYYEESYTNDKDQGLGFVDFQIRPHFNSPDFPNVRKEFLADLKKNNQEAVYALDDHSAIKVTDGNLEIVSEGNWEKL